MIPDLETLIASVGKDLAKSLIGLVDGAVNDIEHFGLAIARNMVQVAQRPDGPDKDALMAELRAQARLLAEQNRIRVNNESWKQAERLLDVASSVLVTVLRSVTVA